MASYIEKISLRQRVSTHGDITTQSGHAASGPVPDVGSWIDNGSYVEPSATNYAAKLSK
jgi:hypothetical protein